MGRKAVGPVCCVYARKRTQYSYRERAGALSTQQDGYVRAINRLYYYYYFVVTLTNPEMPAFLDLSQ